MAKAAAKKAVPKKKEDPYDRLQREVQSSGKRGGDFWKPKEGKHTLRIFSFQHEGEEHFEVVDSYHYFESEKQFVPCTGDCPVCELREEMGDDVPYQQRKVLFNAVVRDLDGADAQVVASLPIGVGNDIATLAKPMQAFDPKKGRDFTIHRTGSGMRDTKYKVTVAMKPSPLGMEVKPIDLFKLLRKPVEADVLENIMDAFKKKYAR